MWHSMEAYFAQTFDQSRLIYVDLRQFTIYVRFSKESNHRGAAEGRAYAFFAKSDVIRRKSDLNLT